MIEKSQLETELKTTQLLKGCTITVKISKSKVILSGRVQTSDQKGEAERLAWDVIGVWTVANELVIDQGMRPPGSAEIDTGNG
ncbi:MAG TPA: BON domain-containing protein [Puia sp.]|nr:BON domain-containing protein [Puia sp.]